VVVVYVCGVSVVVCCVVVCIIIIVVDDYVDGRVASVGSYAIVDVCDVICRIVVCVRRSVNADNGVVLLCRCGVAWCCGDVDIVGYDVVGCCLGIIVCVVDDDDDVDCVDVILWCGYL